LDAIGFDWDVGSKNWEKAFACLKTYKKRIGDCRVPLRFVENGFKLGRWVGQQRRLRNKLSEEQRKRLDQIGFEWNPRSSIGSKRAKANLDVEQSEDVAAEQLLESQERGRKRQL
jgi:hypothetical protein